MHRLIYSPLENSTAEQRKSLDNGTMVEAFKYLNYTQLAKKSLVSKRFWNLIRTNRKYLARLYVDFIRMNSFQPVPVAIKVFNKELSTEAYNEWVACNNYSEQVPLDDQLVSMQSRWVTGCYRKFSGYQLSAVAYYTDPNHREFQDRTSVFDAQAELNQQNWPVFEHFIRLATDPFIYINTMALAYQNDVLNLLAGAINSDRDHLHCKRLGFDLNGNGQKSFAWTKNHVRCNRLYIDGKADLNLDEALLDFLVTGAHCTSEVNINYNDLYKVVVDFVQVINLVGIMVGKFG